MKFLLLTTLVVATSATNVARSGIIAPEVRAQYIVDQVNKAQNFFQAKVSTKFNHYSEDIKRKLMGVEMVEVPELDRVNEVSHPQILDSDVPASFDSRQQWPSCTSISKIRDQSSCGSCWAVAAAETISDRICIASNGATKVSISADDILSCCGILCGNGCNGGYPIQAWKHWVSKGYVTGGNYTEKSGCKPYPYAPCEHHVNGSHYQPCPDEIYPTDKCTRTCQAGYALSYQDDLHFGSKAYAVSKKAIEIQKEIMTNGPVEVAFTVYEDFEHYSSGIYVHTVGQSLGGHAVKMLGWGVENGTPYWLCANSWNQDWGENGYFRIIRGINECGIESGVVGGIPV